VERVGGRRFEAEAQTPRLRSVVLRVHEQHPCSERIGRDDAAPHNVAEQRLPEPGALVILVHREPRQQNGRYRTRRRLTLPNSLGCVARGDLRRSERVIADHGLGIVQRRNEDLRGVRRVRRAGVPQEPLVERRLAATEIVEPVLPRERLRVPVAQELLLEDVRPSEQLRETWILLRRPLEQLAELLPSAFVEREPRAIGEDALRLACSCLDDELGQAAVGGGRGVANEVVGLSGDAEVPALADPDVGHGRSVRTIAVRCKPAVESLAVMRLHYLPGTAPMARHATLVEVGVPYELVRVERDADRRVAEEYLALNPWGKIPTLEDGDVVLTESAAICLYLAEKFPDACLAPPAGTLERAELYRWLFWLSNTVQMTLMRHFYPERYGTAGVEEAADADLAEHFDLTDRHLAGREWIVGEERTVVDLFLFMLTRWGRFLEPAAWERPNLRRHWLRALELPGVRKMIEEQGLELPAFARSTDA